jgi:hypothetical protein
MRVLHAVYEPRRIFVPTHLFLNEDELSLHWIEFQSLIRENEST